MLSWWQDTPLPANIPDAVPKFQSWHEFDESGQQWAPIDDAKRAHTNTTIQPRNRCDPSENDITLVTWNVNGPAGYAKPRIEALVSHILSLDSVDVIFLQEVSRKALAYILSESRIRKHWFSSEAQHEAEWKGQSFISMTLLSRARFGYSPDATTATATIGLGALWRVDFPTRFGRDALCCDILFPAGGSATRVRLINVHLDSLPIQPSRRPQQISIVASYLRAAGRGLVAGDFNPVLDEDEALVRDNGLMDAWMTINPDDPGFTWGVDGKQAFPPIRMDKIAMLGLGVTQVEILHPGFIEEQLTITGRKDSGEMMPWSDHSGLRCCFQSVLTMTSISSSE